MRNKALHGKQKIGSEEMKKTNAILNDINELASKLGEENKISEKEKASSAVSSLAAAIKKLKAENALKNKKLDDESAAAANALLKNTQSTKSETVKKNYSDEADMRRNARLSELKNVYKGITGKEAKEDGEDYLEKALIMKGINENELKETIMSLENKAAAEEKERELEREYESAELRAAEEKLIEDTRIKLDEIKNRLNAEYLEMKKNEEEATTGALSDKELKTLCDNMIKNSTYKGTAYKSLLIREFSLMRQSGLFSEADIERVRKMLYLSEEDVS